MNATNLKVFLLLSLAYPLTASAAETLAPAIQCPLIKRPPKIDGTLGDPCWQKAARIKGFFLLSVEKRLSPAMTHAWLAADDANLYAAFRCKLLPGEKVSAEERPRDGRVWSDDDVEVFLTLDGKACFQFIVNACGSVYDGWNDGTRQYTRWDSDFRAAASKRNDGWSAEMAIPLHCLQLAPDSPKTWGILLCRGESPRKRLSSWPHIGEGGFHQIEKAARLPAPFDLSTCTCTVTGDSEMSLMLGHNMMNLTVSNRTDQPRTVAIETTIAQGPREGKATRTDMQLNPRQVSEIRVPIDVPIAWQDSPEPVTVQARLREESSAEVLSFWGVHADLPPPFLFSIPQTIFYTSQRTLSADARVNVGAKEAGEFLLRFSVANEEGEAVLQESRVCETAATGSRVTDVALDISGLKPGRYDLSVSLLDRRGIAISSASARIMRCPGPFDAPAE